MIFLAKRDCKSMQRFSRSRSDVPDKEWFEVGRSLPAATFHVHSIELETVLYNVIRNIIEDYYKVIYRLNPLSKQCLQPKPSL